jgi:hypothetical protein
MTSHFSNSLPHQQIFFQSRLFILLAKHRIFVANLLLFIMSLVYGQAAICEAAKQGNVPFYEGYEGWMFRGADLQEAFAFDTFIENGNFIAINQALKTKGITLIMTVVPPRGVVYANQLPVGTFDADAARQSYDRLITSLQAGGVLAPNLLEITQGQQDLMFFKTDHHWTPVFANLIAQRVAVELAGTSGYQDLPKIVYITTPKGVVERKGSYYKELKRICKVKPIPETFTRFITREKEKKSQQGLFDDTSIPVVLVGTSNSATKNFNFSGFLKEHLSLDVLNVSVTAGGPFTALQDYLLDGAYQTSPPSILVWEFPIWQDERFSEGDFSQVLASIYGDCGAEPFAVTLEGNQGILWQGKANVDYFILESTDTILEPLQFDFGYEDGQTKTLTLERTDRSINHQRFPVMIPKGVTGLNNITMITDVALEASLTMKLCSVDTYFEGE